MDIGEVELNITPKEKYQYQEKIASTRHKSNNDDGVLNNDFEILEIAGIEVPSLFSADELIKLQKECPEIGPLYIAIRDKLINTKSINDRQLKDFELYELYNKEILVRKMEFGYRKNRSKEIYNTVFAIVLPL